MQSAQRFFCSAHPALAGCALCAPKQGPCQTGKTEHKARETQLFSGPCVILAVFYRKIPHRPAGRLPEQINWFNCVVPTFKVFAVRLISDTPDDLRPMGSYESALGGGGSCLETERSWWGWAFTMAAPS